MVFDSYGEDQEYLNRRERFREDPVYRNKIYRSGFLTALMLTSLGAGTIALAESAEAYSEPAMIQAFEDLAPSMQEVAELLEP